MRSGQLNVSNFMRQKIPDRRSSMGNELSLPTPFYSVLVSISVFIALSTVFHSINSPDNSPFSHSVLPVISLPYFSFQLNVSL